MEYILCRAMEICRLNEEQYVQLKNKESNVGRCLYPSEIQQIFNLPLLKEVYQIPELEVPQAVHNQRLKSEFRAKGLIPIPTGDLDVYQTHYVHLWDRKVKEFHDHMQLDLMFRSSRATKKRLSDQIEEEN